MFDMIADLKFTTNKPIICILHDAYLSSIVHRICNVPSLTPLLKSKNYFDSSLLSQVVKEYGMRAIKSSNINSLNSDLDIIYDYPLTTFLLRFCTSIISHSVFNLHIMRNFNFNLNATKYHIIPQSTKPHNHERISDYRLKLGFKPDDFIVITAGYMHPTKLTNEVIKAIQELNVQYKCVKLICLGGSAEPHNSTFTSGIKNLVSKSVDESFPIKVMGFTSNDTYSKILDIADLGIQLRVNSRGGTPKGVLDFISRSIPVIINDAGSYKDYPESIIYKISSNPTVQSIKESIITYLEMSPDAKNNLKDKIGNYFHSKYAPRACARMYNMAILDAINHHKIPKLAFEFSCQSQQRALSKANEQLFRESIYESFSKDLLPAQIRSRRIYIDVTHISQKDFNSGIQRVVKETTRALIETQSGLVDIIPVKYNGNCFIFSHEFVNILAQGKIEPNIGYFTVDFNPGDALLMIDSSWADLWLNQSFIQYLERLKLEFRLRCYTVIYDILPISYSNLFPEGAKNFFQTWIGNSLKLTDHYFCISSHTLDQFRNYIRGLNCDHVSASSFELGSFFEKSEIDTKQKTTGSAMYVPNKKFILMVGTFEPRKQHLLACEAFLKAYKNDEIDLVLAGRPDLSEWGEDIYKKLKSIAHQNRNIHLIESPSDDYIDLMYSQAIAVLQISVDEGFGLPIIEAANHCVPVICSDIAVFREVGKNGCYYINNNSVSDICDGLKSWFKLYQASSVPCSSQIPKYSWSKGATQILQTIYPSLQ
ncbi:glycosyltransferase [bacterium]|nr:glycosyltransferase [bacterium]